MLTLAGVELDRILARVAAHDPDVVTRRRRNGVAATALVLLDRDEDGPSILFVERAVRAGDRWSGQMALPGGRRGPDDADLAETARREASEEVGVDLGEPVGRLDDVDGRTSGIVVATYVFLVDQEPDIVPDPAEVQEAVWIPIAHLWSDVAPTLTFHRGIGPFPALRYGRYTIWGLTHRIVTHFLAVTEDDGG